MTEMALDWTSLLSEHRRWLRSVVAARVPEPDGIDEVLQEVALAVVKSAAPLLDAARAAPWLYRVAVRQSLLYRRRRGRERKLVHGFAERAARERQGATDPLAWLLSAEREELVRQSLAQLPPRDAQLLLLKYAEHWNYRQMADHLGVSPQVIEARLHRARGRLRAALATRLGEEAQR
jgi:RNA polymerase sigma-70 factor (ECF subfamily)